MPYDELGNYVPGDEPSIDDMRLALAKSNPSGRRQETEAEYKARMVNQLPPAFGVQEYRPPYVEPFVPTSTAKSTLGQVLDRSGITALPQAAAAVLSSYPSAIAKEMGYDKAAQALQYEPTSKYANEMVERLGHAMEAAKVPAYVAHVPMARPYMTPNDVRVLGANVAKTAREIRDIPADFVNAQSGFKRQDIFGQPTLGTRLQGGAESIGDLMARREMQGLSAVPGIPASLVPETKMYAVRPANYGQILEQSDLPGKPGEYANSYIDTIRDVIEGIRPPVEGRHPGHKLATYERNFFSPIDGLRETMRQLEFAKIKEMYPDAPSEADAIEAYRNVRNEKEQVQDKLNWYDEFKDDPKIRAMIDEHNYERQMIVDDLNEAKMEKKKGLPESQKREIDNRIMQLEEELRRKPVVDLPSMAEYERRIKAADRYLNTEFKNEIKKYIGTSEGTMMNLAKKGISFKPAGEIISEAEDVKRLRSREGTGLTVEGELALAREKAGFNPKGETFPLVENSELKLKEAQDKLNELNSEKFALREQHLLENPDIPDPAQNPGELGAKYKALTNKIESAASARDKAKKELDNFRLANAYELLSDYAYVPMTAGYLKNKLPYSERASAFPNLAKTPDDAPMFNVRETMINDATGIKDAADRYAEAIVRGEIPLDKNDRPTKTLDKFIEESTDLRRRKEDLERTLESRKVELLDSYSKDTLNKIPDDLKFGNAAVLELTKDTPYQEVRRQISYDGSVFDHCVAATDAPHPGVNPYTGQRYGYSFPVDPATGLDRTTKSSSYMEQVKAGNTMISSLRDKTSGMPSGTIEFKNRDDNGTYKIGYVSSYKNDPISAEYRNDLRDYLNKRSDIIRDVDQGMAALYKSGVYDTRGSRRQLENAGLTSRDIDILQSSDHPRFITSEDMARLRSAPDESRNGLIEQKRMAQVELDEAEMRLEDLRRGDPDNAEGITFAEETIDDLRLQLQDLDQRIARLPTQNVPARTNMDLAGRRFDVIANAINTGDRAVSAELQSLARRHAIGSDEFGSALAQRIEELPDEPASLRRDLSNALDQWRQSSTVQGERIPSNQQVRRQLTEGQVSEVRAAYRYITDMERFADDYNWDHEGQMNAINAIRNNGDLNSTVLHSEDIGMIHTMNDTQRELLARELEQNFIVNMEHSLDGGVVSLADFEGEVPGITRFYEDARARAEGQLANPARETIQAEPNTASRLVLETAQNEVFSNFTDPHLADLARREVAQATLDVGMNLPDIRRQIDLRTDGIVSGNYYSHLVPGQRDELVNAMRRFASEIAPGPDTRPINPRNNPELVNFDQHTPATVDLNQALQDSLESARGLHPQSSVNAALDALNDISNDIDLTDNPTEFINRVRGRSDNSRGRVSSILSSVADDLETAIEAIQPQQPERRVRRVRGEPGTLSRVMNHAIDQLTNENTGSMQAYTSFMNELEGGTRGMIEASLRDAIALTGDRYSELAMQRFNVDSPAGVHQLNRAFNYTFENLPQNFAAGGLVQRFKDGGSVTDDISTYSQTFENPDSSKTTESGIVKKFEDDYLKFAMQRRELPKQEFMDQMKPQSNMFAEYGTPAMGGIISGRVTKMGGAPDSYMGDVAYRTPVGPGMAHVGVSGMKTPQFTGLSNVNAGYGVPLGENSFAGVNVMQPAQGGKPVYNAQVQYRKRFADGGVVKMKDGSQARNTDDAGYSTSLRMWGDAAYDIAPDDPVRGAGDAARHIIASGDMTRRYGRVPAAIAGYGHEFLNLIRGEQTVDDFLQDIRNNALGRDIGANAKSFEDVIAATKESLSGAKPYEKIPGKAYIMKTGKYMDSYKDGGSVSIDEMRYEIMKGK